MTDKTYSSDKPITDSKDDAFNRRPFAEALAKTILSKELNDGFVIGLYSPWGYGKTSALNMIEQQLAQDENTVIVKFNPWLFIEYQSMIAGFFHTLAHALDKEITTSTEKVGELLGKYSKLLSVVKADGIAETAGELSKVGLDDLKSRIQKVINESGKRIVVIIDDVDRLDKDELFQLFKLIKIGVDFEQLVYLIAFDDKVVGDALGERFPGSSDSGQSFLEKIIQVPLHLPLIDQLTMDSYVLSGVDDVLSHNSVDINQEEVNRFRGVYDEHIAPKISTPRMANRYLNSLRFILPLTGEEINPVDLLLVEAVRLVYPEQYKTLRGMKKALSGQGRRMFMEESEANQLLRDDVGKVCGEDNNLKQILRELFPAVDRAYREYPGSSIATRELGREKRVASPDYFDRYFTYGIPKGDVSDVQVLESLGGSPEEIASHLEELMDKTDGEAVIKKLRGYEDDITDGSNLLLALSKISKIPNDKGGLFAEDASESIAKLMVLLLKKAPETDKKKLTEQAIQNISNLSQLVHFIKWVNIESDNDSEEKLLNEQDLNSIKLELGKKILSLDGKTAIFKINTRLNIHLYHYWAHSAGKETVSKHLISILKTYDDVCDYLTQYCSTAYGSGMPKRGDIDGPTYRFISEVVDMDHIAGIITSELGSDAPASMPQFSKKVNEVGNEKNKDFRKTLASQFLYIHSKQDSNDENEQPS